MSAYVFQSMDIDSTVVLPGTTVVGIYEGSRFVAKVTKTAHGMYRVIYRGGSVTEFDCRVACRAFLFDKFGLCPQVENERTVQCEPLHCVCEA